MVCELWEWLFLQCKNILSSFKITNLCPNSRSLKILSTFLIIVNNNNKSQINKTNEFKLNWLVPAKPILGRRNALIMLQGPQAKIRDLCARDGSLNWLDTNKNTYSFEKKAKMQSVVLRSLRPACSSRHLEYLFSQKLPITFGQQFWNRIVLDIDWLSKFSMWLIHVNPTLGCAGWSPLSEDM